MIALIIGAVIAVDYNICDDGSLVNAAEPESRIESDLTKLKLVISTDLQSYDVMHPVVLRIKMVNTSELPIPVPVERLRTERLYSIIVRCTSFRGGKPTDVSETAYAKQCDDANSVRVHMLGPGEDLTSTVMLNRVRDLSLDGVYSVVVGRFIAQISAASRDTSLVSDPIKFEIHDPDRRRAKQPIRKSGRAEGAQ